MNLYTLTCDACSKKHVDTAFSRLPPAATSVLTKSPNSFRNFEDAITKYPDATGVKLCQIE